MNHGKLPSASELKRSGAQAEARLRKLFAERKMLTQFPDHFELGLRRIRQKTVLSILFAKYMKEERISTVEELAQLLYCEPESLEYLRFPAVFRISSKRRDQNYLLNLCGLDYDYATRKYIPYG